jgi:hypothetical protein
MRKLFVLLALASVLLLMGVVAIQTSAPTQNLLADGQGDSPLVP